MSWQPLWLVSANSCAAQGFWELWDRRPSIMEAAIGIVPLTWIVPCGWRSAGQGPFGFGHWVLVVGLKAMPMAWLWHGCNSEAAMGYGYQTIGYHIRYRSLLPAERLKLRSLQKLHSWNMTGRNPQIQISGSYQILQKIPQSAGCKMLLHRLRHRVTISG